MPFPPDPNRPRPNPPHPPSENPGSLASRINLITTILTAVVAVAAFALSIFNYYDANSEPDVEMSLPAVVRFNTLPTIPSISSREHTFIIQPTFTLAKASTRTAVVEKLALDLRPPPQYRGAPVPSEFIHLVRIDPGSNGGDKVVYIGDAGPVVVTQSGGNPAAEFDLMNTTIISGQWGFTLTATLADGRTLDAKGCLSVSSLVAKILTGGGIPAARLFRNFTPLDEQGEELNTDCYR